MRLLSIAAALAALLSGPALAQQQSEPAPSCAQALTAQCLFEEALALAAGPDANPLTLAHEAIEAGNPSQARRALERLRDFARTIDNPSGVMFVYMVLAHNYGRIGDVDIARRELKAAAALVLSRGTGANVEVLADIARRQEEIFAFDDVRETAEVIARRAGAIADAAEREQARTTAAILKVHAGDLDAMVDLEGPGRRAEVLAYAASLHAGRSPRQVAERMVTLAERAAEEWIGAGVFGAGTPSAVLLDLARARSRLGDRDRAAVHFRRALAEQDRSGSSTPRLVNRVPIALAMIEEGMIAEALASASALDASELALVHRAAARALLKRGRYDDARQAAARARVADRVRLLAEIAQASGQTNILGEAGQVAEESKNAAALMGVLAHAYAQQGWASMVRDSTKKYLAGVAAIEDAFERGEAFKEWTRAHLVLRDLDGARAVAEHARRAAHSAGNKQHFRPRTMSSETEREIGLRAAAEAFALIGDLKSARDLAHAIERPALRAQALASASRYAAGGEGPRR